MISEFHQRKGSRANGFVGNLLTLMFNYITEHWVPRRHITCAFDIKQWFAGFRYCPIERKVVYLSVFELRCFVRNDVFQFLDKICIFSGHSFLFCVPFIYSIKCKKVNFYFSFSAALRASSSHISFISLPL